MKLVITDCRTVTEGDIDLHVFDKFGDVTYYPLTTKAEVAARIADADVVLCNKTPMDAGTLGHAAHLRYIGLFATGYNNVDLAYTNAHGITVCNAGGYSTDAVAQHVFALLLAHTCRVAEYRAFVDAGGWKTADRFSPFVYPTAELSGKTMGLFGFGTIGRAVARIASAFGMRVIAATRTPRPMDGVTLVSFDELLAQADVISVHCPLTPQTMRLFNADAFARCKAGAYFINTSRGGVVDEPALRDAVLSGHLSGAAVDVLDSEPMAADCPLFGVPNLTITPHVAWAPLEARRRLVTIVEENLQAFLDGKPQNVVNQ